MVAVKVNQIARPSVETPVVVRSVTVIMGTVVGLTFLFGFGNVLNLALRLGVPVWGAPLVAPAVDLSIVGLLLATRHLALAGAPVDVLRPARRLLIFASVVTLALNVADPLVAGEFGKAAFDAVGPLLLIGWSEVGPGVLQAISMSNAHTGSTSADVDSDKDESEDSTGVRLSSPKAPPRHTPEGLLEHARQEDAAHRVAHQKPISADSLRIRLGIGATRARRLVKIVRAEFQAQAACDQVDGRAAERVQAPR